MTAPTVESVATRAWRELDALIAEHLFGWRVGDISSNPRAPAPALMGKLSEPENGPDKWLVCPHYSTDPAAFFALMEKVRENGWAYTMSERGGKCWAIIDRPVVSDAGENGLKCLTFEQHKGEAGPNQLPLAFARAALMTTITPKGG